MLERVNSKTLGRAWTELYQIKGKRLCGILALGKETGMLSGQLE